MATTIEEPIVPVELVPELEPVESAAKDTEAPKAAKLKKAKEPKARKPSGPRKPPSHPPYEERQTHKLSSWTFTNLSVASICKLQGVACWNEKENRLISLQLSTMQVSGEVPKSLKYCRSLQTLDLSNNTISGPIPSLHPCEPNDESQAS